jgi:cytochrome c oxidase accessory protein FixG
MLDQDSLQVVYRYDRGEPRGPHKKNQSWEGRGDCIDCTQCVVVCPMGIDIRNGPQLECINCGLCVDACDEMMVKVGRPKGLIAYDSDRAVADRAAGRKPRYRFLRPRTAYYAGAVILVGALMVAGLAGRTPVSLHVLRDRNPTFVRLSDGSIRNGYTLKVSNRSLEPRTLSITLKGLEGASLSTPGVPGTDQAVTAPLAPDETRAIRLFVTAEAREIRAPNVPVTFQVRYGPRALRAKTTFLSGAANSR